MLRLWFDELCCNEAGRSGSLVIYNKLAFKFCVKLTKACGNISLFKAGTKMTKDCATLEQRMRDYAQI